MAVGKDENSVGCQSQGGFRGISCEVCMQWHECSFLFSHNSGVKIIRRMHPLVMLLTVLKGYRMVLTPGAQFPFYRTTLLPAMKTTTNLQLSRLSRSMSCT